MPKIQYFDIFHKKSAYEFPGIRICDKNNISTRTHHLNNTKILSNQFWTRKKWKWKSGARFLAFSIIISYQIIIPADSLLIVKVKCKQLPWADSAPWTDTARFCTRMRIMEEKIFEGFFPYMGVAAILVMWPKCREQNFVPPTQEGST